MATFTLDTRLAMPAGDVRITKEFTAAAELARIEESIADAQTNKIVSWACDVSQVQIIIISSDKALTIKTNNSGAPDDTLELVANVPYVWHVGAYAAFALGTDVTVLYVTNASGSAATLKIAGLYDPTP